jgi:RND family efflux transporter MFP subunit
VKVAEAQMQPLQNRVSVTGRLREVRRVQLTSEVEGKLMELNVERGSKVIGGETVIGRIDEVWAQALLASARADVAEAQAELAQSRSDLQQLESLLIAGSAKQKEVDDARTEVAADHARLDAATAAADRAQTERDRVAIIAPFTGVVIDKSAEVGQWMTPSDPVVTLISSGGIDAIMDVPEGIIAQVRPGLAVTVQVEALGQEFVGEVFVVTPDGTNAARTFPVTVRLDDEDGLLKPGMSVTAYIPVGEQAPRLTVPRDAVVFGVHSPEVWVALKDDNAPMPMSIPAIVKVLFGSGDRFAVEVVDGPLFPGAQVVVEGAESLFPTRPLMIDGEAPVADAPEPKPQGAGT